MSTHKPFIFCLIIVAGLIAQVFACLVTSFTLEKKVAHCSFNKQCPRDSTHCHLTNPRVSHGTCCLGCGRGAMEPRMSCMSHAECRAGNGTSKMFRCRRPMYNGNALGVCCEMKGY